MRTSAKTIEKDSVAARLKEKRVEKSYTQKYVSDKLDISVSLLSRYETGVIKPTASNIEKLAGLYGTTINYLVSGEEVKKIFAEPKKERPDLNHEGYKDPTAYKAMSKVTTFLPANFAIGDVVTSPNACSVGRLIIRKHSNFYQVLNLYADCESLVEGGFLKVDVKGFAADDKVTPLYADYTSILRTKLGGRTSLLGQIHNDILTVIDSKITTILKLPQEMKIVEVVKNVPVKIPQVDILEDDPVSKVVKDSIRFFNATKSKNVSVKEGPILLTDAIDISKALGVTIDDLTKDHSREWKIMELEAKRDAIESEIKKLYEEL